VFANVIEYAIELEELTAKPLDRLSWKPPKVATCVDRRVVVNPRQARDLLTAVTYVGQQRRGPKPKANGSRQRSPTCTSPHCTPPRPLHFGNRTAPSQGTGWGNLTLEKSRPMVTRRWADTKSAHDERTLKHRPADPTTCGTRHAAVSLWLNAGVNPLKSPNAQVTVSKSCSASTPQVLGSNQRRLS
jgi:hypothetical protein